MHFLWRERFTIECRNVLHLDWGGVEEEGVKWMKPLMSIVNRLPHIRFGARQLASSGVSAAVAE
jgi:hypothetical protein